MKNIFNKLIGIILVIFVILCSKSSTATVLDAGIDWQVSVDDYSSNETYMISTTRSGGKIPKTRDLCYQQPLSTYYLNSMKYHSITIECKYKDNIIQIMSMCYGVGPNKDTSYANFYLADGDKFGITILCEKK